MLNCYVHNLALARPAASMKDVGADERQGIAEEQHADGGDQHQAEQVHTGLVGPVSHGDRPVAMRCIGDCPPGPLSARLQVMCFQGFAMPPAGLEPATSGLRIRCSTN